MITRKEILRDRDQFYPLTPQLEANLKQLLGALNKLRKAYGKVMVCTSGYYPKALNDINKVHAPKSAHITCEAADFRDKDGELNLFCMMNEELLEACGLYLEEPRDARDHCHLQTRSPKSGKRVFRA